ncbi:MAG: FtsL-like putative cell division protein [Bacteroidia bacterium]
MANKLRDKSEDIELNDLTEVNSLTSDKKTTPKKKRKKGVLANFLGWIFSGTFLANEKNYKHVPFILFLVLIATLYISYGYFADNSLREVNKISNRLKELRSEFIYTKSELMFASKQSEVAKSAESIGLKEPVVPPFKIIVDSAELNKNLIEE